MWTTWREITLDKAAHLAADAHVIGLSQGAAVLLQRPGRTERQPKLCLIEGKIGGETVDTGVQKRQLIGSYRDLDVYKMAMDGAIRLFELTKLFPSEEKFSLVDQIRRCSRSVCANIAEAWRKRRYEAAFVSKLSDAETEAVE